ncbi:MAG: SDR family NAD(P)-dependent oxidoreductase [Actinomycetota bacterium]
MALETAVVVGATGAIGAAIAERLVGRGLRIVAVARTEHQLNELARRSPLIDPCVADIADNSAINSIKGMLDGPVRMAVFAAGLPVRGSVETTDPDALVLGANIKVAGLVRLLHAVRDHLTRSSRFVTFAGTLGIEPRPHEAGPGAINAAVLNLMRQISMLYGPKGVTVHTIAPGPTDTPRLRRLLTNVAAERGVGFDEVYAEYVNETSLRRLATINEIVWAVMLLLEPEADLMHGGVLHLDGGGLRGTH